MACVKDSPGGWARPGPLKTRNPIGRNLVQAVRLPMENKQKMVTEARLFLRLGVLSTLGFIFYYAHLFFGLLNNVVLFKTLAITFLLATIPLPVIAMNNKRLFPELSSSGKQILRLVTALLLFHHFLMTFIFVMFLRGEAVM